MRTKLKAPKILLIGSSIDYQRFENRFLSLEPLVMQEYDYLKNTVSRISSLSPNLVLVEKSVSRLAQEFLLDMGISLVLNVKSSVMERVARSTQGVIESSADTPIGRPQLGLCHNFYLETFTLPDWSSKTLMFFDGCATHLGCTVLLRGGTRRELIKVKKLMSLMMLVAYNWRLERSFHIDLFAMPPTEVVVKERPKDLNFLISPESDSKESPDEMSVTPNNPTFVEEATRSSEVATPTGPNKAIPEVAEKALLVTKVCDDLSDPLQSVDPSLTGETNKVEDLELIAKDFSDPISTDSTVRRYSFKKALDNVILSASPFIQYNIPYLETDEGKNCKLRSFFPEEIYWSSLLYGKTDMVVNCVEAQPEPAASPPPPPKMNHPHPFVFDKLSKTFDSDHVQGLLADFRRKGHRQGFTPTKAERNFCKSDGDDQSQFEVVGVGVSENGRVDSLDPFKHQKLSVLFCSFSQISCNFPSFCVNPWYSSSNVSYLNFNGVLYVDDNFE